MVARFTLEQRFRFGQSAIGGEARYARPACSAAFEHESTAVLLRCHPARFVAKILSAKVYGRWGADVLIDEAALALGRVIGSGHEHLRADLHCSRARAGRKVVVVRHRVVPKRRADHHAAGDHVERCAEMLSSVLLGCGERAAQGPRGAAARPHVRRARIHLASEIAQRRADHGGVPRDGHGSAKVAAGIGAKHELDLLDPRRSAAFHEDVRRIRTAPGRADDCAVPADGHRLAECPAGAAVRSAQLRFRRPDAGGA